MSESIKYKVIYLGNGCFDLMAEAQTVNCSIEKIIEQVKAHSRRTPTTGN